MCTFQYKSSILRLNDFEIIALILNQFKYNTFLERLTFKEVFGDSPNNTNFSLKNLKNNYVLKVE